MKTIFHFAAIFALTLFMSVGAVRAETPAGDAHSTTVETHSEAEHKAGLPQMDASTFPSQLFWLAVSFLVLFLLMSRVALPTIAQTLEKREDTLKKAADAATTAREQAEALRTKSNALTFGANDEVKKLMDQLTKEIQGEQQKRNKELTDAMEARQAEGEKAINAMIAEAEQAIPAEAADIAKAVVEKLTSLRPGTEQVKKAVPVGVPLQGAA